MLFQKDKKRKGRQKRPKRREKHNPNGNIVCKKFQENLILVFS